MNGFIKIRNVQKKKQLPKDEQIKNVETNQKSKKGKLKQL